MSAFSNLEITGYSQNRTHYSETSLSIPFNHPPQDGRINVEPSSGESLITEFTISALDWEDDDLPLQYKFQYKL